MAQTLASVDSVASSDEYLSDVSISTSGSLVYQLGDPVQINFTTSKPGKGWAAFYRGSSLVYMQAVYVSKGANSFRTILSPDFGFIAPASYTIKVEVSYLFLGLFLRKTNLYTQNIDVVKETSSLNFTCEISRVLDMNNHLFYKVAYSANLHDDDRIPISDQPVTFSWMNISSNTFQAVTTSTSDENGDSFFTENRSIISPWPFLARASYAGSTMYEGSEKSDEITAEEAFSSWAPVIHDSKDWIASGENATHGANIQTGHSGLDASWDFGTLDNDTTDFNGWTSSVAYGSPFIHVGEHALCLGEFSEHSDFSMGMVSPYVIYEGTGAFTADMTVRYRGFWEQRGNDPDAKMQNKPIFNFYIEILNFQDKVIYHADNLASGDSIPWTTTCLNITSLFQSPMKFRIKIGASIPASILKSASMRDLDDSWYCAFDFVKLSVRTPFCFTSSAQATGSFGSWQWIESTKEAIGSSVFANSNETITATNMNSWDSSLDSGLFCIVTSPYTSATTGQTGLGDNPEFYYDWRKPVQTWNFSSQCWDGYDFGCSNTSDYSVSLPSLLPTTAVGWKSTMQSGVESSYAELKLMSRSVKTKTGYRWVGLACEFQVDSLPPRTPISGTLELDVETIVNDFIFSFKNEHYNFSVFIQDGDGLHQVFKSVDDLLGMHHVTCDITPFVSVPGVSRLIYILEGNSWWGMKDVMVRIHRTEIKVGYVNMIPHVGISATAGVSSGMISTMPRAEGEWSCVMPMEQMNMSVWPETPDNFTITGTISRNAIIRGGMLDGGINAEVQVNFIDAGNQTFRSIILLNAWSYNDTSAVPFQITINSSEASMLDRLSIQFVLDVPAEAKGSACFSGDDFVLAVQALCIQAHGSNATWLVLDLLADVSTWSFRSLTASGEVLPTYLSNAGCSSISISAMSSEQASTGSRIFSARISGPVLNSSDLRTRTYSTLKFDFMPFITCEQPLYALSGENARCVLYLELYGRVFGSMIKLLDREITAVNISSTTAGQLQTITLEVSEFFGIPWQCIYITEFKLGARVEIDTGCLSVSKCKFGIQVADYALIVKDLPPGIVFLNVYEGCSLNHVAPVKVTMDLDATEAWLEYSVDGSAFTVSDHAIIAKGTSSFTFHLNTTAIGDTRNLTLRAFASDGYGQVSAMAIVRRAEVDNTPSTVDLALADNTVIAHDMFIQANSDGDARKIMFEAVPAGNPWDFNSTIYLATDTDPLDGWGFWFDVDAVPEAIPLDFKATVYDELLDDSQAGTSIKHNITVAHLDCTIIAPRNDAVTNGSFTIVADAGSMHVTEERIWFRQAGENPTAWQYLGSMDSPTINTTWMYPVQASAFGATDSYFYIKVEFLINEAINASATCKVFIDSIVPNARLELSPGTVVDENNRVTTMPSFTLASTNASDIYRLDMYARALADNVTTLMDRWIWPGANWSTGFEAPHDGCYDFTICVMDKAGNENTSTIASLVIDTTDPEIEIYAPLQDQKIWYNTSLSSVSVPIKIYSRHDDVNISSMLVEYKQRYDTSWSACPSPVTCSGHHFNTTWTMLTSQLAAYPAYDIRVSVADIWGNADTRSSGFMLVVSNDTTVPSQFHVANLASSIAWGERIIVDLLVNETDTLLVEFWDGEPGPFGIPDYAVTRRLLGKVYSSTTNYHLETIGHDFGGNGWHMIHARVVDTALNVNTTTIPVFISRQYQCNIRDGGYYAVSGVNRTLNVRLNVTETDISTITFNLWRNDSGSWVFTGSGSDENRSSTWETSICGLPDGAYKLGMTILQNQNASIIPISAFSSTMMPATFIIDTVPPIFTVEPVIANYSRVSRGIAMKAIDNCGPVTYTMKLDGNLRSIATEGYLDASGQFVWTGNAFIPDGYHVISFQAMDIAGNTRKNAHDHLILVDNTPPVLDAINLTGYKNELDAVLTSSLVSFTIDCHDGWSVVDRIDVDLIDADYNVAARWARALGINNASVAGSIQIPVGFSANYTLAVAIISAGGTFRANYTVIHDTTAPQASFLTPSNDSILVGSEARIVLDCYDNIRDNIASVTLYLGDPQAGGFYLGKATRVASTWEYALRIDSTVSASIYAVVADTLGNAATIHVDNVIFAPQFSTSTIMRNGMVIGSPVETDGTISVSGLPSGQKFQVGLWYSPNIYGSNEEIPYIFVGASSTLSYNGILPISYSIIWDTSSISALSGSKFIPIDTSMYMAPGVNSILPSNIILQAFAGEFDDQPGAEVLLVQAPTAASKGQVFGLKKDGGAWLQAILIANALPETTRIIDWQVVDCDGDYKDELVMLSPSTLYVLDYTTTYTIKSASLATKFAPASFDRAMQFSFDDGSCTLHVGASKTTGETAIFSWQPGPNLDGTFVNNPDHVTIIDTGLLGETVTGMDIMPLAVNENAPRLVFFSTGAMVGYIDDGRQMHVIDHEISSVSTIRGGNVDADGRNELVVAIRSAARTASSLACYEWTSAGSSVAWSSSIISDYASVVNFGSIDIRDDVVVSTSQGVFDYELKQGKAETVITPSITIAGTVYDVQDGVFDITRSSIAEGSLPVTEISGDSVVSSSTSTSSSDGAIMAEGYSYGAFRDLRITDARYTNPGTSDAYVISRPGELGFQQQATSPSTELSVYRNQYLSTGSQGVTSGIEALNTLNVLSSYRSNIVGNQIVQVFTVTATSIGNIWVRPFLPPEVVADSAKAPGQVSVLVYAITAEDHPSGASLGGFVSPYTASYWDYNNGLQRVFLGVSGLNVGQRYAIVFKAIKANPSQTTIPLIGLKMVSKEWGYYMDTSGHVMFNTGEALIGYSIPVAVSPQPPSTAVKTYRYDLCMAFESTPSYGNSPSDYAAGFPVAVECQDNPRCIDSLTETGSSATAFGQVFTMTGSMITGIKIKPYQILTTEQASSIDVAIYRVGSDGLPTGSMLQRLAFVPIASWNSARGTMLLVPANPAVSSLLPGSQYALVIAGAESAKKVGIYRGQDINNYPVGYMIAKDGSSWSPVGSHLAEDLVFEILTDAMRNPGNTECRSNNIASWSQCGFGQVFTASGTTASAIRVMPCGSATSVTSISVKIRGLDAVELPLPTSMWSTSIPRSEWISYSSMQWFTIDISRGTPAIMDLVPGKKYAVTLEAVSSDPYAKMGMMCSPDQYAGGMILGKTGSFWNKGPDQDLMFEILQHDADVVKLLDGNVDTDLTASSAFYFNPISKYYVYSPGAGHGYSSTDLPNVGCTSYNDQAGTAGRGTNSIPDNIQDGKNVEIFTRESVDISSNEFSVYREFTASLNFDLNDRIEPDLLPDDATITFKINAIAFAALKINWQGVLIPEWIRVPMQASFGPLVTPLSGLKELLWDNGGDTHHPLDSDLLDGGNEVSILISKNEFKHILASGVGDISVKIIKDATGIFYDGVQYDWSKAFLFVNAASYDLVLPAGMTSLLSGRIVLLIKSAYFEIKDPNASYNQADGAGKISETSYAFETPAFTIDASGHSSTTSKIIVNAQFNLKSQVSYGYGSYTRSLAMLGQNQYGTTIDLTTSTWLQGFGSEGGGSTLPGIQAGGTTQVNTILDEFQVSIHNPIDSISMSDVMKHLMLWCRRFGAGNENFRWLRATELFNYIGYNPVSSILIDDEFDGEYRLRMEFDFNLYSPSVPQDTFVYDFSDNGIIKFKFTFDNKVDVKYNEDDVTPYYQHDGISYVAKGADGHLNAYNTVMFRQLFTCKELEILPITSSTDIDNSVTTMDLGFQVPEDINWLLDWSGGPEQPVFWNTYNEMTSLSVDFDYSLVSRFLDYRTLGTGSVRLSDAADYSGPVTPMITLVLTAYNHLTKTWEEIERKTDIHSLGSSLRHWQFSPPETSFKKYMGVLAGVPGGGMKLRISAMIDWKILTCGAYNARNGMTTDLAEFGAAAKRVSFTIQNARLHCMLTKVTHQAPILTSSVATSNATIEYEPAAILGPQGVVMNEIYLASSDPTAWVELYNYGPDAQTDGWYLFIGNNDPVRNLIVPAWSRGILPHGSTRVIEFPSLNLGIDASQVWLVDASGCVVDVFEGKDISHAPGSGALPVPVDAWPEAAMMAFGSHAYRRNDVDSNTPYDWSAGQASYDQLNPGQQGMSIVPWQSYMFTVQEDITSMTATVRVPHVNVNSIRSCTIALSLYELYPETSYVEPVRAITPVIGLNGKLIIPVPGSENAIPHKHYAAPRKIWLTGTGTSNGILYLTKTAIDTPVDLQPFLPVNMNGNSKNIWSTGAVRTFKVVASMTGTWEDEQKLYPDYEDLDAWSHLEVELSSRASARIACPGSTGRSEDVISKEFVFDAPPNPEYLVFDMVTNFDTAYWKGDGLARISGIVEGSQAEASVATSLTVPRIAQSFVVQESVIESICMWISWMDATVSDVWFKIYETDAGLNYESRIKNGLPPVPWGTALYERNIKDLVDAVPNSPAAIANRIFIEGINLRVTPNCAYAFSVETAGIHLAAKSDAGLVRAYESGCVSTMQAGVWVFDDSIDLKFTVRESGTYSYRGVGGEGLYAFLKGNAAGTASIFQVYNWQQDAWINTWMNTVSNAEDDPNWQNLEYSRVIPPLQFMYYAGYGNVPVSALISGDGKVKARIYLDYSAKDLKLSFDAANIQGFKLSLYVQDLHINSLVNTHSGSVANHDWEQAFSIPITVGNINDLDSLEFDFCGQPVVTIKDNLGRVIPNGLGQSSFGVPSGTISVISDGKVRMSSQQWIELYPRKEIAEDFSSYPLNSVLLSDSVDLMDSWSLTGSGMALRVQELTVGGITDAWASIVDSSTERGVMTFNFPATPVIPDAAHNYSVEFTFKLDTLGTWNGHYDEIVFSLSDAAVTTETSDDIRITLGIDPVLPRWNIYATDLISPASFEYRYITSFEPGIPVTIEIGTTGVNSYDVRVNNILYTDAGEHFKALGTWSGPIRSLAFISPQGCSRGFYIDKIACSWLGNVGVVDLSQFDNKLDIKTGVSNYLAPVYGLPSTYIIRGKIKSRLRVVNFRPMPINIEQSFSLQKLDIIQTTSSWESTQVSTRNTGASVQFYDVDGDGVRDVLLDSGLYARSESTDRVYRFKLQGFTVPDDQLTPVLTAPPPESLFSGGALYQELFVDSGGPEPKIVADTACLYTTHAQFHATTETGPADYRMIFGRSSSSGTTGSIEFDIKLPDAASTVPGDMFTAILENGLRNEVGLVKFVHVANPALYKVMGISGEGREVPANTWFHVSLSILSPGMMSIIVPSGSFTTGTTIPLDSFGIASIRFISLADTSIAAIRASWLDDAEDFSRGFSAGDDLSASRFWMQLDANAGSYGQIASAFVNSQEAIEISGTYGVIVKMHQIHIDNVTLSFSSNNGQTWATPPNNIDYTMVNDIFQIPWDTTAVPNSAYTIKVVAMDWYGGVGSDMLRVIVDNTKPSTTLTFPQVNGHDTASLSGSEYLVSRKASYNFGITEVNTVRSLDIILKDPDNENQVVKSLSITPLSGASGPSWVIPVSLEEIWKEYPSLTRLVIEYRARDIAGNVEDPHTVNVVVDTTVTVQDVAASQTLHYKDVLTGSVVDSFSQPYTGEQVDITFNGLYYGSCITKPDGTFDLIIDSLDLYSANLFTASITTPTQGTVATQEEIMAFKRFFSDGATMESID
nr:hypothetical protein [Candidatus Sigynarchaeota archaeon]